VAEFCRSNPQAQGGELIEHFKDSEFAAALASGQAALLEMKLEPDNMEVDFHGLVALWQEERSRQKLAALTAKPDPTAAEEVEIRNLLIQITELKNRNDSSRKDAII